MTENAAASGCALDFADYVTARRPDLLRAASAITGNRDSAEDLLQSALVRVHAHWPRIRDHRTADAYIRRTMVNTHDSWLRQRRRGHEYVAAERPEPPMPWPATGEPLWDRWRLWALVTALPPSQRSAVVLCHYEGLSGPEAAAILGCSVSTVRSDTSRALATLRRLTNDSEAI